MKIPKWTVPPPNWKPPPAEPWWLRRGRRFFWLLAAAGVMCFLGSFCGLAENGWKEALVMAVLGAGLLTGAGGTLALSYEKVPQESIFSVKVLVRLGFMAVGPAALGEALFLEPVDGGTDMGPFALRWAGLCLLTAAPFGISLAKLVLQRKIRGKRGKQP